MKRIFLIIIGTIIGLNVLQAQVEKVRNQPYADLKWLHLGFHVGIHSQDLLLTNIGNQSLNEVWFAEVPSYSPGFSVGVIGDLYLTPYLNLRLSPTIHFGDKKVIFSKQVPAGTAPEFFSTNVRSNYLSIPLDLKYSSLRLNNYRPYLLAGVYTSFDLGRKKGNPLLLKPMDAGIEFGLGCAFYLPFFKLCPEIKFCFGLIDLLEKDRTDLSDPSLLKYTEALSRASSRMVVFTFNFE